MRKINSETTGKNFMKILRNETYSLNFPVTLDIWNKIRERSLTTPLTILQNYVLVFFPKDQS